MLLACSERRRLHHEYKSYLCSRPPIAMDSITILCQAFTWSPSQGNFAFETPPRSASNNLTTMFGAKTRRVGSRLDPFSSTTLGGHRRMLSVCFIFISPSTISAARYIPSYSRHWTSAAYRAKQWTCAHLPLNPPQVHNAILMVEEPLQPLQSLLQELLGTIYHSLPASAPSRFTGVNCLIAGRGEGQGVRGIA